MWRDVDTLLYHVLVRRCLKDFLEMLPMPEYCHPEGPLNLAGYLPNNDVKPDLGPKSYVAFGRCGALSPCSACFARLPVLLRRLSHSVLQHRHQE